MNNPIPVNDKNTHTIDFEPVFEMFNTELSKIGISFELVCAGGFVMQLHGYRGTVDVDAFYRHDAVIDDIIRKVGEIYHINRPDELWMNNSISNMNPEPPDEYCEVIYTFSNLTIKAVSITYLIGMKLHSGREQDIKDVADIVSADKNERPLELLSQLKDMGFSPDISDLLDAFGAAHGIDWLEVYYNEHQAELNDYY